jgi:hypothetical protein
MPWYSNFVNEKLNIELTLLMEMILPSLKLRVGITDATAT